MHSPKFEDQPRNQQTMDDNFNYSNNQLLCEKLEEVALLNRSKTNQDEEIGHHHCENI